MWAGEPDGSVQPPRRSPEPSRADGWDADESDRARPRRPVWAGEPAQSPRWSSQHERDDRWDADESDLSRRRGSQPERGDRPADADDWDLVGWYEQPENDSAPDRPARRGRLRDVRQASVTRLSTRWPGQGGAGVPPGFPGSDDRDAADDGVAGAEGEEADEARTIVISTNPLFRRSAAEREAARADALAASKGRRALGGVGRVAGRAPRGFGRVVGAVYAALANPLVNASPEARARRAAQVRRVGTMAATAAVGAVLVYGIFPVRTYLDQRSSTQRTQEELDVLSEANQRLAERAEELRQEETVEEIARRDYGLVLPGEEPYAVLPAPTETTTTTTP